MTPEQLRVRAFKFIETAQSIVESDPDHASYTVGLALEFVLKARFCSKAGLPSFPDDWAEARRLQVANAFIHDLDDLLKLTEDEEISRAANVDWSVASDWGVERRYTPVGDRTVEQVRAQIAATENVCEQLCRYEVMDRLQKVEIEASGERGPFNFFALCHSIRDGWWELVVAFWALDEQERADREAYIDDHSSALRLCAGRTAYPDDLLQDTVPSDASMVCVSQRWHAPGSSRFSRGRI